MIKKPKNGKITANQTMIKILKEPLFPSLWSPLSDFAELQCKIGQMMGASQQWGLSTNGERASLED